MTLFNCSFNHQTKGSNGGPSMEFPVLRKVPPEMRSQAQERLALKRDLGGIFPGAHRIHVGLPGDAEPVSPNGNGRKPVYTALVWPSHGQSQRFQAETPDDLLILAHHQAQLTQDGK